MLSWMKNVVFCVLLFSAVAPVGFAQQVAPPQDQSKHYFTVFTHKDWQSRPAESRLMSIVNSQPMASVVERCHFNHYTEADPVYAAGRFWNVRESDFPVVVISDPRGGYFYKVSGQNVPSTSAAMFADAKEAFDRDKVASAETSAVALPLVNQDCPDGICPMPVDPSARKPLLPNAPWNADGEVDQGAGLLFGDTPIRDSIGWGVFGLCALAALGVLLVFFVVGAIVLVMALYVLKK